MTVARAIRSLPRVRGKVRLGLAAYRFLHRSTDRWNVATTLFDGSCEFHLNLESAHERMAYLMDGYEHETSSFLANVYEEGSILDIGANIGLISIPLAKKLASRSPRIFAFDPIPGNYDALVSHIELNGLKGVITPFHCALGENDTTAFISVEMESRGTTGTGNILPESFEFDRTPVTVRSVDSMLRETRLPDDISLIKIDTDGYDLYVLRGSSELLRSRRPVILAELNNYCLGWHEQSITDAIAFLSAHRYRLFPEARTGGALRFHRQMIESYQSDALLVPEEKVRAFEQYLID